MLKIGLTGGLGSGKTTVSKIFASLSIPVFYADDVAKKIMNEDEVVKQEIINLFGKEAYTETLNRKYIAEVVFKNTFKLDQLNALVHPHTIAAANEWMQKHFSFLTCDELLGTPRCPYLSPFYLLNAQCSPKGA